jgi:hypothetical protein
MSTASRAAKSVSPAQRKTRGKRARSPLARQPAGPTNNLPASATVGRPTPGPDNSCARAHERSGARQAQTESHREESAAAAVVPVSEASAVAQLERSDVALRTCGRAGGPSRSAAALGRRSTAAVAAAAMAGACGRPASGAGRRARSWRRVGGSGAEPPPLSSAAEASLSRASRTTERMSEATADGRLLPREPVRLRTPGDEGAAWVRRAAGANLRGGLGKATCRGRARRAQPSLAGRLEHWRLRRCRQGLPASNEDPGQTN